LPGGDGRAGDGDDEEDEVAGLAGVGEWGLLVEMTEVGWRAIGG
jgi:hypothetical protein